MKNKNILVTWWLWYIWSHTVVEFEKRWYTCIIIDNLSNTHLQTLSNIEKLLWYTPAFFNCDLRDSPELDIIFQKYSIDGVLHFAGLKSVWESCEKALQYFDNNIVWSIKLFECMEKYGVKNIIFSCSATVYNKDNPTGYREDFSVWETSNPYGYTKYAIEGILKNLSEFSNFRVISLRYFNPIWAHDSWLLGENPVWKPNNLLPYIMKVASGELEQLSVFGDDYDTHDGSWVRDYIDVNDLVRGHVLAYEKIEKQDTEAYFDVFNLWTGKGSSVLEVLELSKQITGNSIPYNITQRRKWDLWEVYCDTSKSEKELWFIAKVPLEQSLKNMWKFYNS